MECSCLLCFGCLIWSDFREKSVEFFGKVLEMCEENKLKKEMIFSLKISSCSPVESKSPMNVYVRGRGEGEVGGGVDP